MRIRVNLASQPFVELRPFFLRLRIIMGVLAVIAIGLLIGTHLLNKELVVARAQMDRLQAATQKAQQEKAANERKMRQPDNAAVLTRAHFLRCQGVALDPETVRIEALTPEELDRQLN